MGRDAKGAQKAAQKRKLREQRVRQAKAKRRSREQETGNRRLLVRAAEFPLEECVISKGWQERGLAHILLARRRPDGNLMVGGYYVDTLCLGLKDTAVMPSVAGDEYQQQIKPNLFNDPVEFEACDPGLARAVVEGAVEFAARYGFRPNKRWSESMRMLDGIEPRGEGITFGRDAKPCLLLREGENLKGALARLERQVGSGGYTVVSLTGTGPGKEEGSR